MATPSNQYNTIALCALVYLSFSNLSTQNLLGKTTMAILQVHVKAAGKIPAHRSSDRSVMFIEPSHAHKNGDYPKQQNDGIIVQRLGG
jgi:hypothetical protein